MDEDEDPDDEPAGEPPTVFGLDASPAGCGMLAALGFGVMLAPGFLLHSGPARCAAEDHGCVPGEAAPGAEGLLVMAMLSALFGLAAGMMVRRRLAILAAGGSNRPPLWAAFVALTWLAMPVAALAGTLLLAAFR